MIVYRVSNHPSIIFPVKAGALKIETDSKDQESIYFSVSSAGQGSQFPMYISSMTYDLSQIRKAGCTVEQITDHENKFWRISLQLMDETTKLVVSSGNTPIFDCDPTEINIDNFMFYGDNSVDIQMGGESLTLHSSQYTTLMVDESFIEYTRREQIKQETFIGNAVAHIVNLSYPGTSSKEKMAGVTKAMTIDLLVDGGRDAKVYAEQLIRMFAGKDVAVEKSRVITDEYYQLLQEIV